LIAALVILGGAVVLGAVVGPRSADASSWSSQQGIETRIGYLSGCEQSGGTDVDCKCIFSHLTALPQYNTPAGFNTLNVAAAQYKATGDRAYIPAAYVAATQACLVSTS
jgi:hypothetical protein